MTVPPVRALVKPAFTLQLLMAAAVLLLFVARYQLTSTTNVNWDEFLYLAKVFEYKRGELSSAFQTVHVHLFSWLGTVPGDEVDQVIAGRRAMFAVQLFGAACLWLIGYRLLGSTAAWFALLAVASFSYSLRHGEAFRADPLLAGLFLFAAAALVIPTPGLAALATAALALGVAAAVSVKALLYLLPAFVLLLAAACWRPGNPSLVRQLLLAGLFFALAYAFVLAAHGMALPKAPDSSIAERAVSTGAALSQASHSFAFNTFKATLLRDGAFWLLLTLGAAAAVQRLFRGVAQEKFSASVVLALLLPLLTLPFYRNAFAYFYVCLIPGAALACGYLAHCIEVRLQSRPAQASLLIGLLALPLLWQAQSTVRAGLRDTTSAQRQVLAVVREIFPQPVPYLDRCSMVAAYPKVGMFMSTLVTSAYRARGELMMRDLVEQKQPVFVLANVQTLDLSLPEGAARNHENRLLPGDYAYLQENYIRHWGPIWVAGKNVQLAADADQYIEIAVAGPYTVETEGQILLDRQLVEAGAVVHLKAGRHQLRSADVAKLLTLRHGARLARPQAPPPTTPIFTGLGIPRESAADSR